MVKVVAPCVLKPQRINNYTHLIALLRIKGEKYKEFMPKTSPSKLHDVLGEKPETFGLEEIIEGVLHEKLHKKFVKYAKTTEERFDAALTGEIKRIMKENEQQVSGMLVEGVEECEDAFFSSCSRDRKSVV